MKHKMTKEEAIEILKNAAWLGTNEDRVKLEEAVAMAIQALEDVIRCKDCKHWVNGFCITGRFDLRETDFCSWGEVKKNEIN